jgi:hypothetical protein
LRRELTLGEELGGGNRRHRNVVVGNDSIEHASVALRSST